MRTTITIVLGLLVAAWVGYSLYLVATVVIPVMKDPETTGNVMSAKELLETHTVPGLSYPGWKGIALAVAEALVVVVGLCMAAFGKSWRKVLGLLVVLAWTGLWFAGALYLQKHGWDRQKDVIGLGGALALACIWAIMRLLPSPQRAPTPG